jgi:Putative Zn-dependent protease, contains TPR repeats
MRTRIFIVVMLVLSQISFAQTNEEIAIEKTKEAIYLMDNGNIEDALLLLKEAQKLDAKNIYIPYETALANYLKKDYTTSIEILKKLKKHKDVNPQIFQMLGNSYSMNGERKNAIKEYEEGLKKYPNSGILNLERGNMEMFVENYNDALQYYETGIKVDPAFPSNYYWAAKIYCNSTEEVWGMIYGEIFMNLERNSDRTVEISQLIFDTYKSEIQFPEENKASVSFSENAIISMEQLSDPENFKLPFGVGIYEITLILALVQEKEININSLDRIRTNFLKLYYDNKNQEKYPNALFDYQNKIFAAGHMEAYNHWILMQGDWDGFEKWNEENMDKWNQFVDWFIDNPIELNEGNKFYREQY